MTSYFYQSTFRLLWCDAESYSSFFQRRVQKRTGTLTESKMSLKTTYKQFYAILSALTCELAESTKTNLLQLIIARRMMGDSGHFDEVWFWPDFVAQKQNGSKWPKTHIIRLAMMSWERFVFTVSIISHVWFSKLRKNWRLQLIFDTWYGRNLFMPLSLIKWAVTFRTTS